MVGYILYIEFYLMQKILKFTTFQRNRDLFENSDPAHVKETELLKGETPKLNEGILDIGGILSKASSAIFGSFSRAGQIDELRKVILTSEIAIVQDGYELEDEIDELGQELSNARKSKDDAKIKSLSNKITLKSEELREMIASHKASIKRAEDVLDKIISKSERLRKYYEAGKSEDAFDLAQIKYKIAKDRSASSEKIAKAKAEMDLAKKEAESAAEEKKEMLDKKEAPKEEPKKPEAVKPVPSDEPIKVKKGKKVDSTEEKKIVASKRASNIIQHKKDLAIEIADLKYDLEQFLEKVRKKIARDPKSISQKTLDKIQMDALEIASNLDSKKNLLDLYKTMGKTQSEIAKTSARESKITEISNRINQAIADGNDSSSGTKKTITDAFREGISLDKIQKAIEEISKV